VLRKRKTAEDPDADLKGEVKLANHSLEFFSFYEKHKRLCDEMSGLKIRAVGEATGPDVMIITRDKFHFAIRRLDSFLINYLHNTIDKSTRDRLESEIYNLEEDFLRDELYQRLIKKNNDLSPSQDIEFDRLYLSYLIRAFNISHQIGLELQKTLLPSTKSISSHLKYYDYNGFYRNLNGYRDEMSDDLSNFTYGKMLNHLKKITGYYFTYRYLINKRNQQHIDRLLSILYSYVNNPEVLKEIKKIKESEDYTNLFIKEIKSKTHKIKKTLNKIYLLCNISLSVKNILPKPQSKELLDKTLM